jgi:SAM-dependent methyltransferase
MTRTITSMTSNDSNKLGDLSPSEQFIPRECRDFLVKEFPTLTSLLEQGKDSSMGGKGGEWSACTHVKLYGMNFASFFARHLAYGLKPKSVLEFGCGLGTTSDFLARFVPGGSKVVCVEPEAMIGEVFGEGSSQAFPIRPLQLSMLSFAPEARRCSDAIYNPQMQFELVLSLEVAEHVPPEFTDELIRRLATATTKYLVFAAARPGQGGTGHIDESMHDREWWIERFQNADRGPGAGKLHLLPQLSRGLRYVTAFSERAYDLGTNLIAFGAPGVEDIEEIPQIAHDCSLNGRITPKTISGDSADKNFAKKYNLTTSFELERPCDGKQTNEEGSKYTEKRAHWVEGHAQALWPELDLLIRRVKKGELKC